MKISNEKKVKLEEILEEFENNKSLSGDNKIQKAYYYLNSSDTVE